MPFSFSGTYIVFVYTLSLTAPTHTRPAVQKSPSLLRTFYPGLSHAIETCIHAILNLQQTLYYRRILI